MAQLSVVGKDVIRVDALDKVTGKAKYTADFSEVGMLHARLVRSPHAHARIIGIDTSQAERLPGVRGVVLPQEAPEARMGQLGTCDRQVLPRDGRVRFVGEPVVMVVADTPEIAEEAVGMVRVNYEELPAVFDAEVAMVKECPVVIHPDKNAYMASSTKRPVQPAPDMPNIASTFKIRKGDVEKGFQEADLIVENRFSFERESHGRMERHVADAWVESDGTLVVRRAAKGIWRYKDWLCSLFSLPPSRVRVIEPYIGGDFGGKGVALVEGLAALAAMKVGKKVRLEYTREEEFLDTCMGPAVIAYIKDGVKRDGTIVARETRIIIDGGAYVGGGSGLSPLTVHNGIMACYRIPNWKSDAYAVYTNNPPTGTLRGVDAPKGSWAAESQMDCIAHELEIDPVEIRRRNLVSEGDTTATGQVLDHISPGECLEKAAELIQWGEKIESESEWKRGKGIALCNYGPSPNWPAAAIVKLLRDGTVEVRHGTDEVGQGLNTVVAQIAAEEFGTTVDRVRVVFGDTLYTPWDWASGASRCTWNTGNAVILACRDAKQQLFSLAAKRMGVSAEELDVREGRVYSKSIPGKLMLVGDLFVWDSVLGSGEILGKGNYQCHRAPVNPETGQCADYKPCHPYMAYGVEVAVSTETGEVKVLGVSAAVDVGQPINWKMCEGQIEGGTGMGIGQGLYEQVVVEKGVMVNPNFVTYRFPTAMEMPGIDKVKSVSVGKPHPEGPYGAKAIGEMTVIPFFAALGNAVYDAVGVRIKDAPITREKVFWALEGAGKAAKKPRS